MAMDQYLWKYHAINGMNIQLNPAINTAIFDWDCFEWNDRILPFLMGVGVYIICTHDVHAWCTP